MVKYTFSLPQDLLDALKADAQTDSRTIPAVIRLAIQAYLASEQS